MDDILFRPGEEVIDAQDLVTVPQQSLAQMRAEKTSSPGDQYTLRYQPLHCSPRIRETSIILNEL